MSNHDLDWVAAQRPQRAATDREAHDRALLALLRHASSRPVDGRRRRPKAHTGRLGLAAGVTVAAFGAATVLMLGNGATLATPPHQATYRGPLAAVHHSRSATAPLVRLANYVSASATPPGDATLVQRTTNLAAGPTSGPQSITVYDLYADNGNYYFSQTESGLSGQVSAGDTHYPGAGQFAREVAAAKEAATGNVQQAGIAMAEAPDPSNPLNPNATVNWAQVKTKLELMASTGDKFAEAELQAGPAAMGNAYDNYAWENSQDALIAGAGDPQVRAGVLKILATLPGVTVTQGTTASGEQTLVLRSGPQETGAGYTEQLTIDANTGVPIQFVGGVTNDPAATTVNYKVVRVTLADVGAGQLPSF